MIFDAGTSCSSAPDKNSSTDVAAAYSRIIGTSSAMLAIAAGRFEKRGSSASSGWPSAATSPRNSASLTAPALTKPSANGVTA